MVRSTCFLDAYKTFVFCQRGLAGEGWRQKSAAQQNNSLVIKSLQTQAVRNSRNRWRVSNMLKKHHHHHHRHRHQNHIINLAYTLQFPIER